MNILRIIVHIVSAPFGFLCLLALSKWKYSRKKTFKAAAVFIAVTTVINFFIVSRFAPLVPQYPLIDFIYRVGNMLSVFVAAMLLTRQQKVQMMFAAITAGVYIFTFDTIAITIRILFKMYPLELLFEFLVYPVMTALIFWMRKPFLEVTGYMKNRLWPLCGVLFFLLVCLFSQISFPRPLDQAPENIPVALMICGISVGVYGILFFLFKTLRVQGEMEHNVMAMKLYTFALEQQNRIAGQNEEKAALFRHDLRHFIQMLSSCTDNGDMDGVRELLQKMDENVIEHSKGVVFKVITGHKLLDTTLSYYINSARESGIDIDVKIEPVDCIYADKTELSVVIANALENAINACERLPEGRPGEIELDGSWRGKQYFLEIANTCDNGVRFDHNTGLPMSCDEGHGLGSQSIAFFARKHGAALHYNVEDGWFRLQLLLNMK